MFVVDADDIALIPMSPAARETFMKMDFAIADLTKRVATQDKALAQAEAKIEHLERLNMTAGIRK